MKQTLVRARRLGLVAALALGLAGSGSAAATAATHHPLPRVKTCLACTVTLDVHQGPRGQAVNITGAGFPANATVKLQIEGWDGVKRPLSPSTTPTDGSGNISVGATIPGTPPNAAVFGPGRIVVTGGTGPAYSNFRVVKTCTTTPAMKLTPARGPAKTLVTINGTGWCAGTRVKIKYVGPAGRAFTIVPGVGVTGSGTFVKAVRIPASAHAGIARFRATDTGGIDPIGQLLTSSAFFRVT
jgi:hypothetical protein